MKDKDEKFGSNDSVKIIQLVIHYYLVCSCSYLDPTFLRLGKFFPEHLIDYSSLIFFRNVSVMKGIS